VVLEGHRRPVISIVTYVDVVMGCHLYNNNPDHEIKVWWVFFTYKLLSIDSFDSQ